MTAPKRWKYAPALAAATLICALTAAAPAHGQLPWTGFNGGKTANPARPAAVGAELQTKWRVVTHAGGLAPDGARCVVATDRYAVSVTNTAPFMPDVRVSVFDVGSGERRWFQDFSGYGQSGADEGRLCPAVIDDLLVVTLSTGVRVLRLQTGDPEGDLMLPGGDRPTSAPAADVDRVYVTGEHTYDHDGDSGTPEVPGFGLFMRPLDGLAPGWQIPIPSPAALPPLVPTGRGVVLLGYPNGTLHTFNATNGASVGAIEDIGSAAPVMLGNDVLFARRVGDGQRIVRRAANGSAVDWETPLAVGESATAIAATDAVVYVQVGSRVRALNVTSGSVLWTSDELDPNPDTRHASRRIDVLGNRIHTSRGVLDAETGAIVAGTPTHAPAATAVVGNSVFAFVDDGTADLVHLRDTKAPVLTVSGVPAGGVTTDRRPTFAFAADDGLGVGGGSLRAELDGAEVAGPAGTFTPSADLADGAHSFAVGAQDAAGNRSVQTFDFTVDTTPPSAFAQLEPGDTAVVEQPVVTLRFQEPSDEVGVEAVELLVDGRRPAQAPACSDGVCVLAVPLADGTHRWKVRATDRAGLVRETPERTFTTRTPPLAALTADRTVLLTGETVAVSAAGSTDPAGDALRFAYDLDGDGSAETPGEATASTSFATPGPRRLAVVVTDAAGNSGRATVDVQVRRSPPAGVVGVSIEDGAAAVGDADVSLRLVWPRFADRALIANDGGFREAKEVALGERVPWTLITSGSERLPKTVYVRFLGAGNDTQTFTDDVILDTTAPRVQSGQGSPAAAQTSGVVARVSARRRIRSLRLRASDNASGVTGVQITTIRRRPGDAIAVKRSRRLDTRLALPSRVRRAARVYVRVIDAAGNVSAWKSVRLN